MWEFENDINNFVDNFIGEVVGRIDLGTLDNLFKIGMISASALLLALTMLSLLFYKFFNKKGVRVTAYVVYSIWIVASFAILFVLLLLTRNWFNILDPLKGVVDPLIEKFRNVVGSTPTTKNFFEGFVGSVFGSGITLENLSTQAVVQFLLTIPLIIGWVNIGFIWLIMFSIIFGPKFAFIKMTTQVVYFIIFFCLMAIGIWALVSSIQTDIKVATSIEMLLRSQAHIITSGLVDGISDIKDQLNDFLDGLGDDITEENIGTIIDKVIEVNGDTISIIGGDIEFNIDDIGDLLNIPPDEIVDKISDMQQELIEKGPENAKEFIDNIKDWMNSNLK